MNSKNIKIEMTSLPVALYHKPCQHDFHFKFGVTLKTRANHKLNWLLYVQ